MKKLPKYYVLVIGLVLTFSYLLINIITIDDYGVTWDFTYHFNVGLWHIGLPMNDPTVVIGPSAPLSDILPTLSYLILFEKLKLMPWDAAYNLYSVIIGSLGAGILFFGITKLIHWKIGLASFFILAFLPRYFGHLHNNMKDIPQSVFFMISLFLFWRLQKNPTLINLLLGSFAFALSYNSKVNAIFILIIGASYLCILTFLFKQKIANKTVLLYFITAPLAAFTMWMLFWNDPIDRLFEATHSYSTSTTNMPVLYFGKLFYSGINMPSSYPFSLLAVTTPFLVLIFFLLGLMKIIIETLEKRQYALFILLWLFIPLSRYFKPHMIVIDDVRHFMEVLFPLSIISGIGAYEVYLFVLNKISKMHPSKIILPVQISMLGIFLFYLFMQISQFHPYQTSYFNELIGGIKGAQGKFDIEFWASSYKHALTYLNQNAPQNAKIIISMAPDIARLYLRPDLQKGLNRYNLAYVDPAIYTKSDFTVILNRQSFWQWYSIYPYIKGRIPLYTLTLQSIPLVSIYKN